LRRRGESSTDLQDRFRFSRHLDDMGLFSRNLDVYINTSVHEGIPMSVLEAMSHNLPVVVSKVVDGIVEGERFVGVCVQLYACFSLVFVILS